MSDFRQASNPRKRLSTAVLRDFNQNVTMIPRKANQKVAVPRKMLSTAASEDALPPIKKRKTYAPSEKSYPSDEVRNTVRRREAIENRTLFCHSNAPDVPGSQFRHKFNMMMRDNKLSFFENVVFWCSKKSGPHDFKMEFVNADMATRALNLDGFTLRDRRASIHLRRPPYYNGPPETHKTTWNEFAATRPHFDISNIRNEKEEREVYIYVPLDTDHDALREFLGDAIQRASLNIGKGNPIISCKVNGNSGFITLRTSEEAAATLNLNNIPFHGARLFFQRNRNVVAGRYQNLHHDQLKIPIAKDTHIAPCPQRLERDDFEVHESQLPLSGTPPTSGEDSCCSLLPQDPPFNHEGMVVDLKEENLSTPQKPKKRVRFNLKNEDEGSGAASDGKGKHQGGACAKGLLHVGGEKSAAPTLDTQDCHTAIDEQHTKFVQSVLNKVNEDREDLRRQLEKANVEKAQLQQQLSEMAKRLAESDASRACLEKLVLNEKRKLPAIQQQLVIIRKMWRKTAHELEDVRQLHEATENRMQAASIHFDKPLLGPSIKQEESFVKCEGGIQYAGSERVRVLLEEKEEFWDV